MKTIAHMLDKGGNVIGIVSGPDAINQSITVNGRVWKFDFDEYGGPLFLKADSYTARKCQNPNKAVWKEWESWHRSYRKKKMRKRVDSCNG